MQLTLRQLQIFRAISMCGSTSAGAASVPLSQSATSAALNELERALGARLFDRVGKRLVLNDNGRAVLPAALAVLDGAHGIEAAFQSADRRSFTDLRVSASTTIGNYLLPTVLAQFRKSYPQARLELRIGNTLNVAIAVRDFAVDMGLIEGPCRESDLQVLPWLEDELVIVAAATHPLARAAKHRKLTADQLRSAHWLLREHGSGTREAVEAALLPHVLHLQSATILGSSEAIKYSVAVGLGLSCLSRCVVQDLVAGKRLSILSTQLPRLSRQFSLIYHREKVLSKPLAAFMTHCRHLESPLAILR
jgi:DNA-binding transcriptional LysR family regulator